MRNYLKYPPWKLRKLKGPCTPQGPSFSWARPIKALLAGTQLQFKTPSHSPEASYIKQFKPKGDSLSDFHPKSTNEESMPDQSWLYSPVAKQSWSFYGSWFSGPQAELSMSITVRQPKKPRSNVSFFHPKVLEHAIAAYLTSSRGHDINENGEAEWQAPLNWQPITDLPVPAVRFDILPMGRATYTPQNCLAFPIGDHHLVFFSFSCEQFTQGTQEEKDKNISRQPLLDLINNILNSITLTLSPEAKKQLDTVKTQCPDMSVTPHFPPLKWPVKGTAKTKIYAQLPGLLETK